ncbi:uncharacterized protein LOC130779281 [Actinidia eriantha]|uniref:uncharacterized protein LOC130779281 n=1 Tax=Actinidia eriantha TaxID=165200 RepID=UPI0025857175|nr:uncharacterized protein LOC130779281 [Actinidia eriantha]
MVSPMIIKLIDRILLVFLLILVVAAPLDAGLLWLSRDLSSDDLMQYLYIRKYGEYLATRKPSFFVALIGLEVVFQWPLAVMNLYGISLGGRPRWFRATTAVFGSSYCTSMVAVVAELKWPSSSSYRVSDNLLMAYFLLIGCGVLIILRGSGLLLRPSHTTTTTITDGGFVSSSPCKHD